MNTISAIIAVKGTPPHILETIRSINNFVSEIIIVDIGMSGQTRLLMKQQNLVTIVSIKEDVPYIEVIREQLKQYAKNDYILFLDPDEIVSPKLQKYLKENLANYDYFSIPRKNMIFKKWIQHSRWWPDYQVRLFKKDMVTWPTRIHSQPETNGGGMNVPAHEDFALIHHNYESIDEFMEKLLRYTKAEAKEMITEGKTFTAADAFKKSISEFVGRYFAAEGYKDGAHGFALAVLQMFYYILVYLYYWQEKKFVDNSKAIRPDVTRKFFYQGLFETNYWLIKNHLVTSVLRIKLKLQNVILKILG